VVQRPEYPEQGRREHLVIMGDGRYELGRRNRQRR